MSVTTTPNREEQKENEVVEKAADFDHHPAFFRAPLSERGTQKIEVESVNGRKEVTYHGEIEIPEAYNVVRGRRKPTGPKCFSTQRQVCDAWLDMTFPAHNFYAPKGYKDEEPRWQDGHSELYTWSSTSAGFGWGRFGGGSGDPVKNFRAVQWADGTGRLIHYDTTAAIRTKNGLIINNQQNWAGGFARVTEPRAWERDYELPLDGISDLLESGESIYDIVDVLCDEEDWSETWNGRKFRRVPRDAPKLVLLASGDAICIGRDSTASEYNQSFFGFRVDADELSLLRSTEQAIELLKPDLVAAMEQRGLDIYERDGKTDGNRIVRQGEWFLIPVDEDFDDSNLRVEKVYSNAFRHRRVTTWEDGERKKKTVRSLNRSFEDEDLGSHIPREKGKLLPRHCEGCGSTSFEMDENGEVECNDCGYEFSTLYVRGTFRHIRNEHGIVNLGERWHAAVTHDRDVMVFDTSSGTGTGGGWD